jgi:hypothetical protein
MKKGEYWLARLLEREARGRFVQVKVNAQFEHLYDFSLSKGVDVVDPATGARYEILSGTTSNLARHGRRTAGEFFRRLTSRRGPGSRFVRISPPEERMKNEPLTE